MIHLAAFVLATVAFVPLDDRPVTAQLPALLGRIAGVGVDEPGADLLGRYLSFGNADAIVAWLNREVTRRNPDSFVVSSDMLAYGGLVASRVPGASFSDAYSRLRVLDRVHARRPAAWIACFATIMRLAPTGVPGGTPFFAAYPLWQELQLYANLPDPLPASDTQVAQALRERLGPVLDAYLATRQRNLGVNRLILQMTARGTIDQLAIGQDDAGPAGLHVREVAQLRQIVTADPTLTERVSIEPGADELGMVLVAHALARTVGWTPRIAVRYSTAGGALVQDPLEFAPISDAIEALIRQCGGLLVDDRPDIVLYVRVPFTPPALDDALVDSMGSRMQQGIPVAFADVSFLAADRYRSQASFAERLLASGLASKLESYASWNTNANTVGTALSEAIAAGVGRRSGDYDDLAHRTFTFVRFLDDYAFHDDVRDELNATLDAEGIVDHTLLSPAIAGPIEARARALLWQRAETILPQLDPGYHVAALTVALPWGRTFETRIEVGLAPDL